MQQYAAFHLGLRYLAMYLLRGVPFTKPLRARVFFGVPSFYQFLLIGLLEKQLKCKILVPFCPIKRPVKLGLVLLLARLCHRLDKLFNQFDTHMILLNKIHLSKLSTGSTQEDPSLFN